MDDHLTHNGTVYQWIKLEALRLFSLPEAAPAGLYACSSVPVGTRGLAVETTWGMPSMASGATGLTDVTLTETRQGDMAQALPINSKRFIDLTAFAWTNNAGRITARNISDATSDLAAVKRRVP